MSKGSGARPKTISYASWLENWDRIFNAPAKKAVKKVADKASKPVKKAVKKKAVKKTKKKK